MNLYRTDFAIDSISWHKHIWLIFTTSENYFSIVKAKSLVQHKSTQAYAPTSIYNTLLYMYVWVVSLMLYSYTQHMQLDIVHTYICTTYSFNIYSFIYCPEATMALILLSFAIKPQLRTHIHKQLLTSGVVSMFIYI